LDLYTQASKLRKDAADNAAKSDAIGNDLMHLQQDLAVAQGQQQLLQAAVDGFHKQEDQLRAGWQEVTKRLDDLSQVSKALYAGGEPGASSAAPSGAAPSPTTNPAPAPAAGDTPAGDAAPGGAGATSAPSGASGAATDTGTGAGATGSETPTTGPSGSVTATSASPLKGEADALAKA